MTKRAEKVDETRHRIVEATVRLHTSAGLGASVASIATEAGVTRLTVYRHFPDHLSLIRACTAHWLAARTPPDPEAWKRVDEPEQRLRAGLTDVYRFYREGEPMLSNIHRDWQLVPEELRAELDARDRHWGDVLVAPLGAPGARPSLLLPAVVGHALAFGTWHSLCTEHGLSDRDAVLSMTTLILALR